MWFFHESPLYASMTFLMGTGKRQLCQSWQAFKAWYALKEIAGQVQHTSVIF